MLGDNSDNSDDVLIELSNLELESYRVFYKNLNQPEFVYVHLYLKNQLRWNIMLMQMNEHDRAEISDRCKMRFYRYRNGEHSHKTLIGITGDKEYTIFVTSLDESLQELRKCLSESSLIQWDKLPLFVAVHERFRDMIYEILETRNVRVRFDNRCSTMWMDRAKALTYELSIPDDVEMKPLNVNEYRMMNDAWPYKYPGSECFIKTLITLNGGLGVYRNGKLVSWILHIECFGIGLLQTLEEYQGKGYARLLTRAITKQISEDYDEDVILFASHSRPKTVELYTRYEYQHVSYTHWFYLENICS